MDPLPGSLEVVQLGLRDWEMGKNYPASMAVRSDVRETLKDLTPRLRELGGDDLVRKAQARNATRKKR